MLKAAAALQKKNLICIAMINGEAKSYYKWSVQLIDWLSTMQSIKISVLH